MAADDLQRVQLLREFGVAIKVLALVYREQIRVNARKQRLLNGLATRLTLIVGVDLCAHTHQSITRASEQRAGNDHKAVDGAYRGSAAE